MKYINLFKTHASYEEKFNGGVVDISLPNVSYCEDVKDVHYTPNLVRFYVGDITGTTQQTVKIYTDETTSVDVQVSEGNKWYTYLLPKKKGLYKIEGDSVKKVVVKADINNGTYIIPFSTIEASFKGSNTSNLTSMYGMFLSCSGLTSLNVSNFNTSNVTSMGTMFYGCSGLKSLDVSSFDTSNVTTMSNMFNYCSSLISLDVSRFDTSNVTDMSWMFNSCSGLKSLDLRNFNTSNVTNMVNMFENSSGLTSLDLSGWNTSKVDSMSVMFKGCNKLETLDISGWNTSKVANMNSMFNGCTSLKKITMKKCSSDTIDKIKAQLTKDGISLNNDNFVTE